MYKEIFGCDPDSARKHFHNAIFDLLLDLEFIGTLAPEDRLGYKCYFKKGEIVDDPRKILADKSAGAVDPESNRS